MSFGNIVGKLLQEMTGKSHSRLEHTVKSQDSGRLMDIAQEFLRKKQGGGMTGGQFGGLGALAGALLGGGSKATKGAVGGSAIAILGALAASALQNKHNASVSSTNSTSGMHPLSQAQAETLTSPESERLIVRAMITAAKADGQIDQKEIDNIFGKIDIGGVTNEERQFVMDELSRPMDLQALVSAVPNQAVAAEVYAASLFAIDIDTDAEKAYLRQLAQALGLDAGTVSRLHALTSSPAV